MCLIGHLPFLFLLFQHFLYLDSTQLTALAPPPPLPPSLDRPLAPSLSLRAVIIAIPVRWTSLLCVHDTALIEKHAHMHSHGSTHHTHPTHHGFTAVVPLVPPYTTPIPPSI